jgi:VanZ family protein
MALRNGEDRRAEWPWLARLRTNRGLPWVAVLAWMALIFALSSQSTMPDWAPRFELQDIAGHLVAFGILAALLRWAFASAGLPRPAVWAFGAVVLYAFSDEFHQRFVPGRHADPFDLLVDAVGALLALTLLEGWLCRRPRRPPAG